VTILSHLLSKPTGSNSKLTLQAVKWSKDETAQVAQVRKLRNPPELVTHELVTIFSHRLSKRHNE